MQLKKKLNRFLPESSYQRTYKRFKGKMSLEGSLDYVNLLLCSSGVTKRSFSTKNSLFPFQRRILVQKLPFLTVFLANISNPTRNTSKFGTVTQLSLIVFIHFTRFCPIQVEIKISLELFVLQFTNKSKQKIIEIVRVKVLR